MTTKVSETAMPARLPGSLEARVEKRLAVERHFSEIGHSYRHGKLYRQFEHDVTRPLLKLGLQAMGVYHRGLQNALLPVVRRIPIHFANLPPALDGFEILHLSDFHIDKNPALADALAPVLRELHPDLCVFTGDYRFEDSGPCEAIYPPMTRIVDSIDARYGIYGILGNHDAAEIAFGLERIGVRMLVNEGVPIGSSEEPLWLAGVDDPFDYRCADLDLAMRGAPHEAFKILLAHAPEMYAEADREGINLYLSGHTHAGQIRLPIVGALRHNADCPREYTFGLWRHGRMYGYTSAGVGCSTLPVRYGCPPEIVLIELRRA